MKMSFDAVKTAARATLNGERVQGAALMCIAFSATVFFSVINLAVNRLLPRLVADIFWLEHGAAITCGVSLLTLICTIFLINPLHVYIESWFVSNLAAGRKEPQKKSILESAAMGTVLFSLKLLWLAAYMALPCFAAAALTGALSISALNVRTACALAAGTAMLFIISVVFWLLTVQRYACAVFYLVAMPGMTVSEALTKSREVMRGKCCKMLAFKASFLPWFILCLTVFPAGYVIPYYRQSLVCYKALVLHPISR